MITNEKDILLGTESVIAEDPPKQGSLWSTESPRLGVVTGAVPRAEVRTELRTEPTPSRTRAESLPEALRTDLDALCGLIANVTESYSAAVFLRKNILTLNPETTPEAKLEKSLRLGGVHTLSRDFIHDCEIPFGSGLIGWTAENGARICVSPFEHDATTLLCYKADQDLKSFVSIPILSENKKVLGVIVCDSKKSYAFAKLTEKILIDCAQQARSLLKLYAQIQIRRSEEAVDETLIRGFFDSLRNHNDEDQLLSAVANLPGELIERDGLVVMAMNQGGVGKGVSYSSSAHQHQHRLLELVSNHKRLICADRSVHTPPTVQSEHRSFLSVPFRVLEREAGSINILSRQHRPLGPGQISLLERIAVVVGQELERIRLRQRVTSLGETNGILSWKNFAIRANIALAEARAAGIGASLIRIQIGNFDEIESIAGVDITAQVLQRIMRVVDQIKGQGGCACYLYGTQILMLVERTHAERMIGRLQTLIGRLSLADFSAHQSGPSGKLGQILVSGSQIAAAHFPENGETLTELVGHSLGVLQHSKEIAAKQSLTLYDRTAS